VGSSASDMYHGYIDMRHSVQETCSFATSIDQLTTENLRMRQSGGGPQAAARLLGYAEQFTMPTTMAEAVMLDISGRFKSIIIGSRLECRHRRRRCGGQRQWTDRTRGADTNDMGQGAARHRQQLLGRRADRAHPPPGVLRGDGSGGTQLFDIPSLADVRPGDPCSPPAIDGIYPKGIPVGVITRRRRDRTSSRPSPSSGRRFRIGRRGDRAAYPQDPGRGGEVLALRMVALRHSG